jgi:hypothetical protein
MKKVIKILKIPIEALGFLILTFGTLLMVIGLYLLGDGRSK